MHFFEYRDGQLYCEDVPLKDIAKRYGTPTYVYSGNTIIRHFKVFDGAFSELPHLTCFSIKSNSNIAILNLLSKYGSGMDIVSGGELYRALKAGVMPEKIVYSGVGKTKEEMEYALREDILMFNVESFEELDLLNSVAKSLSKFAKISLRVNPDVDPKTHPYISTGLRQNKFGVDIKDAISAYKKARELSNLQIIGVSCHIGSQLTQVSPFVDALERILALIGELKAEGITITHVDIGGGLGIRYDTEEPPHPEEYAKAIKGLLWNKGLTLILEPGRVIVGNAGILLTRVLYHKTGKEKDFIVVDAAMNDLIRPSLYGSYHSIWPVELKNHGEIEVDVVGPICESGDFFAKKRKMQKVKQGDLLSIMSAGAYGFSMSSNYNSRPRAAEILVLKDKVHEIRKRETYEDLVRNEFIYE